jgi:hypothetical protein
VKLRVLGEDAINSICNMICVTETTLNKFDTNKLNITFRGFDLAASDSG